MQPVIQEMPPKMLVGMRIRTSRTTFQPYELWSKFMPKKKYIDNTLYNLLYSVQVYDAGVEVLPTTEFDQWAAVEVSADENIPEGMEIYYLRGGLYATFIHKGAAKDFPKTMHFIHEIWLPQSGYEIDNREHFEVLGEKYIRASANSEEEVWVPIKLSKV